MCKSFRKEYKDYLKNNISKEIRVIIQNSNFSKTNNVKSRYLDIFHNFCSSLSHSLLQLSYDDSDGHCQNYPSKDKGDNNQQCRISGGEFISVSGRATYLKKQIESSTCNVFKKLFDTYLRRIHVLTNDCRVDTYNHISYFSNF